MTSVLVRHPTDVTIVDCTVELAELRFRHPLALSSGEIHAATYAAVTVEVRNGRGQTATGRGGVILSDLWAFPSSSDAPRQANAAAMRSLVTEIAGVLPGVGGAHDPFQIDRIVRTELPSLAGAMPHLATSVCWAPFDAAIHDAWARAAGRSAYEMYDGDHLGEDLAAYLGPAWHGLHPAAFLGAPRRRVGVQHVVGLADSLTEGPDSLAAWIERDGVRFVKIKVTGHDVGADVARVIDVYAVAVAARRRYPAGAGVHLSIDANEGGRDQGPAMELLRGLEEKGPAAYAALDYVEQPTPRGLDEDDFTLHDIARRKPVIVDEGLDGVAALETIAAQGWSGIALKTCKGQSQALLAYSWARRNAKFVVVQDLTNPGLALVQSANLADHLALSVDALEYNSRQYLESHRLPEAAPYQQLFDVVDGEISLGTIRGRGLY